jgi:DNA-binding transcriptional regulator YiaG
MTETYHYKDSGLDYVYLVGGVTSMDAPDGEAGYAIADVDGLNKAIAKHVVTSPRPICGQEVRFLRSVLDLSQTSLAKIMGVDRSTIARWEGEPREPIRDVADTAIRLVYAGHQDVSNVMKEVMDVLRAEDDKIDCERITVPKVTLSFDNGWRRTVAA